MLYPAAVTLHGLLAWAGFIVALVMLGLALYIGLVHHGDVTPGYRRATFAVAVFVGVQFALGALMYLSGGRPGQEVHLIYGFGTALALPFFIYVEMTARKRPAMGSYMWGYGLLAAIFLRAIVTGA